MNAFLCVGCAHNMSLAYMTLDSNIRACQRDKWSDCPQIAVKVSYAYAQLNRVLIFDKHARFNHPLWPSMASDESTQYNFVVERDNVPSTKTLYTVFKHIHHKMYCTHSAG